MTDEKNLISLKDAAKISGYSADYIGQLIRAGKIPGKQVCCTVAWMTTADAVTAYKNKGNASAKLTLKEKFTNRTRMMKMELDIIKLFFKTFKYSLPLLLVIFICFISISFFVVYLIGTKTDINAKSIDQIQEKITF